MSETERELMVLAKRWAELKDRERFAACERRAVEDAMTQLANIPLNKAGVKTMNLPGYKVKITGKVNYKVNSDQVQDLARSAGLESQLTELFRWEPRLDVRAWTVADDEVKSKLAPAITAKPGRPGFVITKEED